MKTLIVLVVGLLADGCLTPEQKQKALRASVVGEYKQKNSQSRSLFIYSENGIVEWRATGSSFYPWSIVNKEIHAKLDSDVYVYRINEGKSITLIARIGKDGKRTDISKEFHRTFKKIK